MLQMREDDQPQRQAGGLAARLVSYLLVHFINSSNKNLADHVFA